MNILSLFDGMSCGRIALERAGIPVTNYFASEIDKYAIQVSKANWYDIKHIGSVTGLTITYDDFLGTTNIYNFLTGEDFTFQGKFDLIIGGSPCQGFSFAGLQLNFNDPRSKLFFEFAHLLAVIRKHNPEVKYFLENVLMKKMYQDVITKTLGGDQPIMLNSALVSAQNRKRLYWTNIPFIGTPEDRGIVLRDILETGNSVKRWVNSKTGYVVDSNKSATLKASIGGGHRKNQQVLTGVILDRGEYKDRNEKAMCLDANYFKGPDNRGQRTQIKVEDLYLNEQQQQAKISYSAKTWKTGNKMGAVPFPTKTEGKAKTLCTAQSKTGRETNVIKEAGLFYRKLTPIECERLQTVEDGYTQRFSATGKQISNTQAYKMLGNGWTIEAIVWFFLPLHPGYNFLF
jgi:DNA-cytosine methyltransferase